MSHSIAIGGALAPKAGCTVASERGASKVHKGSWTLRTALGPLGGSGAAGGFGFKADAESVVPGGGLASSGVPVGRAAGVVPG